MVSWYLAVLQAEGSSGSMAPSKGCLSRLPGVCGYKKHSKVSDHFKCYTFRKNLKGVREIFDILKVVHGYKKVKEPWTLVAELVPPPQ